MKTTWAYKLIAPYSLEKDLITLDNPPTNYVELEVLYCALCASDITDYLGEKDISYPRYIGHEFVGRILSLGVGVDEFIVGDTVTSDLTFRCGHCVHCKNGQSHMCIEEGKGLFTNRAFAQKLHIHKDYLYNTNSIQPKYRASLTEPLACALHALDLVKPKVSDKILVIGCGGIGALSIISLLSKGFGEQCFVYDILKEKEELLVHSTAGNVRSIDNQYNYSLIIEASGDAFSINMACERLAKGGRICIISRFHKNHSMIIPHRMIATKEGAVFFSHHNGEPEVMEEAISILSKSWKEIYDDLFSIEPYSMIPYCYENYSKHKKCKIIFDIKNEPT